MDDCGGRPRRIFVPKNQTKKEKREVFHMKNLKINKRFAIVMVAILAAGVVSVLTPNAAAIAAEEITEETVNEDYTSNDETDNGSDDGTDASDNGTDASDDSTDASDGSDGPSEIEFEDPTDEEFESIGVVESITIAGVTEGASVAILGNRATVILSARAIAELPANHVPQSLLATLPEAEFFNITISAGSRAFRSFTYGTIGVSLPASAESSIYRIRTGRMVNDINVAFNSGVATFETSELGLFAVTN